MNRFIYITITIVSLLFTACSNEMDTIIQPIESEIVHLSINLDGGTTTKAQSYQIPDTVELRYILEIWAEISENQWVCDPATQRFVQKNNANEFDIKLPKGFTYKLAVWVDYVNTNSEEDLYYQTDSTRQDTYIGLSNVAMINNGFITGVSVPYTNPAQDAYAACVTWSDTEKDLTVIATRPLAQLNIFAEDMNDWTGKFSFYGKFDLSVVINGGGDSYNVLDGTILAPNVEIKQTNLTNYSTYPGGYSDFSEKENNCFFSGYVFASATGNIHEVWIRKVATAIDIELTNAVNKSIFAFDFVADNNLTTISKVPLKRNYATNISGDLLFQDCTFTVTGSPIFTNTYTPQVDSENP